MKKISYCLWFNGEAEAAANFYALVFKNVKINGGAHNTEGSPAGASGTVLTVSFNIEGQDFLALNGGPEYQKNPSISFMVHCKTVEEVDELWGKLSVDGDIKMPLDKYPFSEKYGWVSDQFGVSWQIILSATEPPQKIMPSMMFVGNVYGKVEEAINFYISIFENSKIGSIFHYGENHQPDKIDAVMFADFSLENQWFAVMESARVNDFTFTPGISFIVSCDTQNEIDNYWEKLTTNGKEIACGWLVDKYGVSWQIVPSILSKLMGGEDREKTKRVTQALMKMVKLDIAKLEQA